MKKMIFNNFIKQVKKIFELSKLPEVSLTFFPFKTKKEKEKSRLFQTC